MKRIIIVLCFLMSIKATQAQTIDTTIKYCVAAKIVPFVYSHDFPIVRDTISHLGVFEYKGTDTSFSVSYTLIGCRPIRNVVFDWQPLTQEEMKYWNGDLSGLLPILRTKFGLTFK